MGTNCVCTTYGKKNRRLKRSFSDFSQIKEKKKTNNIAEGRFIEPPQSLMFQNV